MLSLPPRHHGAHARRVWQRYLLATVLPTLALGLMLVAGPILQRSIFLAFFAAVALAALYGGTRPGLLATALSVVLAAAFIVTPFGQLSPGSAANAISLAGFAAVALLITRVIGALHAALAQRRAGERRYRALVDASTRMVWRATAHGPDDMPFWRQLTGQSQAELQGDGWANAIHPDDRQRAADSWAAAVRTGSTYQCEYRLLLRDGTVRWFRARAVPVAGRDQRGTEWIGVFDDIDDHRRRADHAAMFDALGAALVGPHAVDDTIRVIADAAVPRMADWCAIDIIQGQVTDSPLHARRVASASATPDVAWLADALDRGYPPDWRLRAQGMAMIDGQPRLWPEIPDAVLRAVMSDEDHQRVRALGLTSAIIVPITRGDRVIGTLSLSTWVSRRRYAEHDLLVAQELARRAATAVEGAELYARESTARASAEMAAARTRLLYAVTSRLARAVSASEVARAVLTEGCLALGASGGMVFLVSDDGTMLEILDASGVDATNVSAFRSFPLDAAVPPADAVRSNQPVYLESKDEARAQYPHLGQANDRSTAGAWAVVPLVLDECPIGALSLAFPHARHFEDDDRELVRALALQCAQALDRARLFRAERLARREAESANQVKAEFLARMSHELRTPLNAIGGHAQLIEMGVHGPVTDAQRTSLERVHHNQQHLVGLINDILDFSRIEAGALRLDSRPVPVPDLVLAIEALLPAHFAQRGLALITDIDPALVVRGDRSRITQVLLNLLSNAGKASRDGATVSLSARMCAETAETVELLVSDCGDGIPDDQLEAIFTPFTQLGRSLSSRHEGTGLGLAISRELARSMSGDLLAASIVGHGSTFTLRLPRYLPDQRTAPPPADALTADRTAAPAAGPAGLPMG
jgi:PAS domain S-box-containing protein